MPLPTFGVKMSTQQTAPGPTLGDTMRASMDALLDAYQPVWRPSSSIPPLLDGRIFIVSVAYLYHHHQALGEFWRREVVTRGMENVGCYFVSVTSSLPA